MNYYTNFILTVFLLFSAAVSISANNDLDQILDNSDITWAAEVYTDYVPNINSRQFGHKKMKAKYGLSRNYYDILKIQNEINDNNLRSIPSQLSYKLLQLKSKNLNVFSDANLKNKLSYADYQEVVQEERYDTIITFDPETFTEVVQLVLHDLDFNAVEVFRVKQIIHYNSKTKQLGITPLAIAPIQITYNNKSEPINKAPLFWMPINEAMSMMDLDDKNVNWAKRLIRSISNEDLTILKGKGMIGDVFQDIIQGARQKSNEAKFYHTFGDFQPLTAEEVESVGSGIDTIITFDPVTFKETVSVVTNEFTAKSIQKVRLIQNWVWNKETQQMHIRLIAFAPIVKRYDNAGNFLNSGPLFYKKPNE